MFTRNLLAAAVLALTAGAGFAQDPAANPVQREDARNGQEQRRIKEGVQNGSVTPHEAKRLERQQARIHRAERRSEKDGAVTPQEQAHIEKMQDKASKNIYEQKHDGQGNVSTPNR